MWRACLLLVAVLVVPAVPAANAATGEAVAVLQRSVITAGGHRRTLSAGDLVSEGDMVQTSPSGEAQILFPDGTRIVVGRSSALRIDRSLFRSSGAARRLGVSALAGSFRFISGASRSRAYSVRTPTATLGVRGTAFDVAVPSPEFTDLAVFDGSVRFCGRGRRCVQVDGGCRMVRVNQAAQFMQPQTREQLATLVAQSFPYIGSQQSLLPTFRVATGGCDEVRPIRLPRRAARDRDDDDGPELERDRPERDDPPEPPSERPDPPEPEPASPGNPAE